MMGKIRKLCIVVVCLLLLPLSAMAQEDTPYAPYEVEGIPLTYDTTRYDFECALRLHADGFPAPAGRLEDWERFLAKFQIKGFMNSMNFLTPYSRVFMDFDLLMNGENVANTRYDATHSYRYLLTSLLGYESIHFQMHNFFDFMFKPYYYWNLPTQYIALFLYPEAAYYVGHSYYRPIADLLEESGSGTRNIPYERLYELCETWDTLVSEDDWDARVYCFVNALLYELYATEMTVDALSRMEDYLDFLDPGQEGMNVVVEGGKTTLSLGETTVYVDEKDDDGHRLRLTLPNADGYTLSFDYARTPGASGEALSACLQIRRGEETAIEIAITGEGLPGEGDTSAEGTLAVTFGGYGFTAPPPAQSFAFRWERSPEGSAADTRSLSLTWNHPDTGLAAITLDWRHTQTPSTPDVFVEELYPQEDFFSLNEYFMEQYKEQFLPTLVPKLLPILLQTPAGVIDDVYDYLEQTGMLLTLGIE